MLASLVAAASIQTAVSDPIPAICNANNSVPETCFLRITTLEEQNQTFIGVLFVTEDGPIYIAGRKNSTDGFKVEVGAPSLEEEDLRLAYGQCVFMPSVLRCTVSFNPTDPKPVVLEAVTFNVQP